MFRLHGLGEETVRVNVVVAIIVGFAALILPGCSNTSASTVHSVTFTVTATNGVEAENISYMDTSMNVYNFLNVTLPWTLTVALPVSETQNTVGLSAQALPLSTGSVLTGTITDNGSLEASQSSSESTIYMSIDIQTLI